MRYGKLMLGGMLMAAMLGTAACSQGTTDNGMSGSAGLDSGAPAAGAASVGEVLAGLKAADHIDLAEMEKACGKAQTCLDDLANFKAFLATKCASATGCDTPAAMLLYVTRTKQQEQAKMYPSTFPPVSAILLAYNEMSGAASGGESGGSAGGGSGGSSGGSAGGTSGGAAAGSGPLADLKQEISNAGGTVTIDQISSMLAAKQPDTAPAVEKAIKAALLGVQPNADVKPIADNLLKGQPVTATEALVVLKAIEPEVTAAVGGGGSTQPGAGASMALDKAIAPVLAMLSGAMGSQQVKWSDIKVLIVKNGGEEVATKVETALENLPQSSGSYSTAEQLLAGKEVAGTDAGQALVEAVKGAR